MKLRGTLITIFLILTVTSAPASSQLIIIEGESYSSSHDIDYGVIAGVAGPGCSGGDMLVGLDYPNEWVRYDTAISPYGKYATTMKCRGDLGVEYRLQLSFMPEQVGPVQVMTFQFIGAGYG